MIAIVSLAAAMIATIVAVLVTRSAVHEAARRDPTWLPKRTTERRWFEHRPSEARRGRVIVSEKDSISSERVGGDYALAYLIAQKKIYENKSKRTQRSYSTIKVVEIVMAALVPAVISLNISRLFVVGLSATIVTVVALELIFRPKERWIAYRVTYEALRGEQSLYEGKVGPYSDQPNTSALLTERVESILGRSGRVWVGLNAEVQPVEAVPSSDAERIEEGAERLQGPILAWLDNQIRWFDHKSRYSQRLYTLLKLLELAAAAVLVVLVSLNRPDWRTRSLAAMILAAIIVLLEGALSLFQFQERWIAYRSIAGALQQERLLYLTRAGSYVSSARLRRLLERIEDLLSWEHAKWTLSQQNPSEDEGSNPPTLS